MNDTTHPADRAGEAMDSFEAFIAPVAEALETFDEGEKYP